MQALPIYPESSPPRVVPQTEFIEFWTARATAKGLAWDAKLYTPHIGKPLTRQRLEALFEWKNQMPASDRKRRSLEEHYFARSDTFESLPRSTDPSTFLKMCGSVTSRAIWGIFLLHC